MGVLRSRAPEQIRRDALALAERKAEAGCEPCAEAYLSLARRHGASEQEVDHARRRLFKSAGALAGVGLVASLLDVPGALAEPRPPAPLRLESLSTVETVRRRQHAHQDTQVRQLAGFLHDHGPPTDPATAQVLVGRAEGTPLALLG